MEIMTEMEEKEIENLKKEGDREGIEKIFTSQPEGEVVVPQQL